MGTPNNQNVKVYSKTAQRQWARYVAPRQRHGREHAVEAMSDWGIRAERNAGKSAKTDPLVAFATFVHGTVTPGCGCEECDSRRDLVMTLIYDKDIDTKKLNEAIYDGACTKDNSYTPDKCRVCGLSHQWSRRVMGTEMNSRCYRTNAQRRLHLLLLNMDVHPKRRVVGNYRNLVWLANNLRAIRTNHESLEEALELVQLLIGSETSRQRLLATG